MRPIHEIMKCTHNDIEIYVKINHLKSEVSLVDLYGDNFADIKDKHFLFSNRGLEFMPTWQEILDAMKYAIAEATKILEKDQEEDGENIEKMEDVNTDSDAINVRTGKVIKIKQ